MFGRARVYLFDQKTLPLGTFRPCGSPPVVPILDFCNWSTVKPLKPRIHRQPHKPSVMRKIEYDFISIAETAGSSHESCVFARTWTLNKKNTQPISTIGLSLR